MGRQGARKPDRHGKTQGKRKESDARRKKNSECVDRVTEKNMCVHRTGEVVLVVCNGMCMRRGEREGGGSVNILSLTYHRI